MVVVGRRLLTRLEVYQVALRAGTLSASISLCRFRLSATMSECRVPPADRSNRIEIQRGKDDGVHAIPGGIKAFGNRVHLCASVLTFTLFGSTGPTGPGPRRGAAPKLASPDVHPAHGPTLPSPSGQLKPYLLPVSHEPIADNLHCIIAFPYAPWGQSVIATYRACTRIGASDSAGQYSVVPLVPAGPGCLGCLDCLDCLMPHADMPRLSAYITRCKLQP